MKLWAAVHFSRKPHPVTWWRWLGLTARYWVARLRGTSHLWTWPSGCVTYSFTETGIGTVVRATCDCGASIDATDYGSW